MDVTAIFFIFAGAFSIAGGAFDWNWFMAPPAFLVSPSSHSRPGVASEITDKATKQPQCPIG